MKKQLKSQHHIVWLDVWELEQFSVLEKYHYNIREKLAFKTISFSCMWESQDKSVMQIINKQK